MKTVVASFSLIAFVVILSTSDGFAAMRSEAVIIHPVYEPTSGVYTTQFGGCTISMKISDMGGFTILALPLKGAKTRNVEDVTGVAYLPSDALIFTVSPMYGRPGIYRYDCLAKQVKQLVRPRTINKGYPDGADYFELQDVQGDTVYVYYSSDINATDFERFRSPEYLYKIHSDGSGFRKALE
ncbi:MAG: hypothetical protein HOP32_05610 [Nitrospira sp.]|nr:hypothetical protein [Nitrospira sp.]